MGPVLREVRDLGRRIVVARIAEVSPGGPGVKFEGGAIATLAIRRLTGRDQRGDWGTGNKLICQLTTVIAGLFKI